MTFTALTGAASHFVIGGTPDWIVLLLCVLSTLVFAQLAARFANKAGPAVLNRLSALCSLLWGCNANHKICTIGQNKY